MLLLCGASASGKTEIVKLLTKRYAYHKFITTTTRPKRPHEVDGIDYYFLDSALFNKLNMDGGFIETTDYQTNQYGSRADQINDSMVAILDPSGINAFYSKRPREDYIVYIKADKDTRKYRMLKRDDDLEVIWKRLDIDDETFHPDNLTHIDLNLENNSGSLNDLADTIHTHYQAFLKERP
mgnify:FL=1